MENLIRGKVKFFNKAKGYGFIAVHNKDIFFHISNKWIYETENCYPQKGDIVHFEKIDGRKGPKANRWRFEKTILVALETEKKKTEAKKVDDYVSTLISRVCDLNCETLEEAKELNKLLGEDQYSQFPTVNSIRSMLKNAVLSGELKVGDKVSDEALVVNIDQEIVKSVRKQFPSQILVLGTMIPVKYSKYSSHLPKIEITGDLALRWQELPDKGIELQNGTPIEIRVEHPDFKVRETIDVQKIKRSIKKKLDEKVLGALKEEKLPDLEPALKAGVIPKIIKRIGKSSVDDSDVSLFAVVVYKRREYKHRRTKFTFKWEWFTEEYKDELIPEFNRSKKAAEEQACQKRIEEDLKKIKWFNMFDNFELPDIREIRDGYATIKWRNGTYSLCRVENKEDAKEELNKSRVKIEEARVRQILKKKNRMIQKEKIKKEARVHESGCQIFKYARETRDKLKNLVSWDKKNELVVFSGKTENKKWWKYNIPQYSYIEEYPPIFDTINDLIERFNGFSKSVGHNQIRIIAEAHVIQEWVTDAGNAISEFNWLVKERQAQLTEANKLKKEFKSLLLSQWNSPDRIFIKGEIDDADRDSDKAKEFIEWHQYVESAKILRIAINKLNVNSLIVQNRRTAQLKAEREWNILSTPLYLISSRSEEFSDTTKDERSVANDLWDEIKVAKENGDFPMVLKKAKIARELIEKVQKAQKGRRAER